MHVRLWTNWFRKDIHYLRHIVENSIRHFCSLERQSFRWTG